MTLAALNAGSKRPGASSRILYCGHSTQYSHLGLVYFIITSLMTISETVVNTVFPAWMLVLTPILFWGALSNFYRRKIAAFPYTPDTRSRNRRQKPAPENWRRFLERLSYNLAPDFSGARFWSRIEHVLFRDRIWRPRDQNTAL